MEEGYKFTSVKLPVSVHRDAKINFIEFNEALMFGIKFKLAEKGKGEYPYSDLKRQIMLKEAKIRDIISKLEITSQENFKLKEILKKEGYNYEIEVDKEEQDQPLTDDTFKDIISKKPVKEGE